MKNTIYEDCFREKITLKKLAIPVLLFSMFTGFTLTGQADAGNMLKTEGKQIQQSPPVKEDQETGNAGTKNAKNIAAARVNGVIITEDSVIKQMKVLAARKEQGEDTVALRTKALDSLIFSELAIQKARADGLTLEQKALEAAIEKVRTSYGDENGYRAFLEREALTDEGLREIIERSFLLKLVLAREVSEKITVTEEELKLEYEKEKDKYRKPEKLTVIDVVFFLKIDDADSLKKAEAVLKKINEDAEKNPLNLTPDSTFIVRELEVRKEEEPKLYETAKTLKTGEVSGVIRTADSLHVIRLKEYMPERLKTLDEVRRSIDVKLLAEAKRKRLQEFKSELKKAAKIEIIDAKGSE